MYITELIQKQPNKIGTIILSFTDEELESGEYLPKVTKLIIRKARI